MFAVIISWIAISIVFLSFGDFLISIYNRLCKKNELYGLTDTFLLGMCFTLIPLSLSSLWLPSNLYILFAYLILSILYWIFRRERFLTLLKNIRSGFKNILSLQAIIFAVTIISFIVVILWQVGVFDSLLYHQQNIRWNEEYAIVPGLGNLEHRFSFNSSYLLLSAVFSFRFLFGEAVYSLHVLVLVYVVCWILKEIISSGYEIKRLALLLAITGYIFIFGYTLTASSTDLIPNIVTFYLIAKLLLYPDIVKRQFLLLFFVAVSLVTFKLSIIAVCLISLFIFVYLIKAKDYRTLGLLTTISSIVIILWLIRNVILSGYLIFPLYSIDLFDVDWKLPVSVAIEEKDFIYSCGIRSFGDMIWRLANWQWGIQPIIDWFTYFIFLGSIAISPFVVLYSFFKKKYLNKTVYFAYLILVMILLVWYTGGPDPRFIGGILFITLYFNAFLLLSTKEKKSLGKTGTVTIILFACLMGYWAISRTINFTERFYINIYTEHSRPMANALWRQYPYKESLISAGIFKNEFIPYRLNNGETVYISKSPEIPKGQYVCFESPFPGTTSRDETTTKYQDISEIETRGKTLQEGFRPKLK
ncbi:MAG: LIC_10190 family membrane protein [Dysgonomonas sp.]